jgi:hypothetical protein
MISGPASRTLVPAMGKLPQQRSPEERSSRNSPLWIHVSQAGKWLLYPREARKRAVIRLLDEVARRRPGPDPG